MQDYAKKMDEERNRKLYGNNLEEKESPSDEGTQKKDAKFLKELNQ